jgi:hypothetical protein
MESNKDLYCKIFVDTDIELDMLIKKIAQIVSGSKEIIRTIVSENSEIDVVRNDDFDTEKRHEVKKGFLYSKYYLDIEPNDQTERKDYILSISLLIQGLRDLGYKSVPSCDFEEELTCKSK